MNELVAQVRQDGPLAYDDCQRTPTPEDKLQGLAVFRVRATTPAAATSMGRLTPVVYLPAAHTHREVIEAWVAANAEAVATADRQAIRTVLRGHGRPWYAAIDAVVPKVTAPEEVES